ncbi:hypothetical protein EAI_04248, partial [Harpegnathos saltator]
NVLLHMQYSSYFASSNYHLFCSLLNSLNRKKFDNLKVCKIYLDEFFVEKNRKFFEDNIFE